MSAYSITTRHKGKMAFEAEIGNHKVIMDTVAGGGGEDSGPPPKKLLLGTLATCTGMDVVSLLQKMRVAYSDFDIVTNAAHYWTFLKRGGKSLIFVFSDDIRIECFPRTYANLAPCMIPTA